MILLIIVETILVILIIIIVIVVIGYSSRVLVGITMIGSMIRNGTGFVATPSGTTIQVTESIHEDCDNYTA